MPQFNNLNLPAIHQAAQSYKANEFNRGRAELTAEREDKVYDDSTRLQNTRFVAGATKVLLGLYDRDPNEFFTAAEELGEEGIRRGILDPDEWDAKSVTIEKVRDMHNAAIVGLAGRPIVDPTAGSNVGKTWINPETQTMWGMTRSGQSFDTGIPAQQYGLRPVETATGMATFDPSRSPSGMDPRRGAIIPGTSAESMRQRAVQDELATGEAARGRVQAPGGAFEAVEGSQAAVEEEERRREILTGGRMKSIQAQTVVEDVTRLSQMLDAGKVPLGRSADFWAMNPDVLQSRAYRDAESLIKSVQGNVGVDQLINIKKSGAGLGQVPQAQLNLLSRLLGELDMGQSEEQFMFTWKRMGRVYDQIWQMADADMRELNMPPPIIFSLTEGMTMVNSPDEVWGLVDQGILKPGDKFLTPDGAIKRVPNRTQ
jgi:hypothetical protein